MELLFFLLAFIAEIAGTVAGFGSSAIALPLSVLIFDYGTALVLVAFLHIFGSVSKLTLFRFGFDRDLLVKFGLPSVLLTFLGALLVSYIPQNALRGMLGAFLIAYTLVSWNGVLRITPRAPAMIVGGGLSGFLAGLIGTGGALRGAFLTAFGLTKDRYIATAAAIALAVDIVRLPVYLAAGFFTEEHYWMLPILFFIALGGSYIGKRIVDKLPREGFRRVVLLAICLAGAKFIYDLFAS